MEHLLGGGVHCGEPPPADGLHPPVVDEEIGVRRLGGHGDAPDWVREGTGSGAAVGEC